MQDILRQALKKHALKISDFQPEVLEKRFLQRMDSLQIYHIDGYKNYLETHSEEWENLTKELVKESSGQAFLISEDQTIKNTLQTYIEENIQGLSVLRVWIIEFGRLKEVYDIAIFICELLEEMNLGHLQVRIFATETNGNALSRGRDGYLTQAQTDKFSEAVMEKYFRRTYNGKFQPIEVLRQMVIFSRHDVLSHPPFLRVDLISCNRTLSILPPGHYNNFLHKLIYAMKPRGLLLTSDLRDIHNEIEEFTPISTSPPIFRCTKQSWTSKSSRSDRQAKKEPLQPLPTKTDPQKKQEHSLARQAVQTIWDNLSIPFVVVNDNFEVMDWGGDLRLFVNPIRTRLYDSVLDMVSRELHFNLQFGIKKIREGQKEFQSPPVLLKWMDQEFHAYFTILTISETTNKVIYFRNTPLKSTGGKSQEADELREQLKIYLEELEASELQVEEVLRELQASNEELNVSNQNLFQLNQELYRSRNQYKNLVESSPFPIVLHQEHTLLYVNQAAVKVLEGESESDLIGRDVRDFMHREDQPLILERIQELASEEKEYVPVNPERFVTLKGNIIDVEVAGVRIEVEGKPAIQVMFSDVTERKKALKHLKNKQTQISLIHEVAKLGIWEWDIVHQEVIWAESMYRLLGMPYEEERHPEEAVSAFLHPDDAVNMRDALLCAKRDGVPYSGSYRFRTANGTYINTVSYGQIFKDEGGNNLKMVGITIDISDRIKKEQEIQELNLKLEEQILRRTDELERTNQELQEFAYSISHDLRTPLRHLISYSRLLKSRMETQLDKESEELLSYIEQGGNNLNNLIQGLLQFSRLGNQPLEMEEVNINEMIGRIVQKRVKESEKYEVEIHQLPTINGDPLLLEKAFREILDNAFKFSSRKEKATIRIFASATKNFATYSIQDNGIGLDMNYSKKIFGIFQRLNAPEEFEGEGIGLAFAQRIISRHRGQIEVKSEVGKGATFSVKLPLN